eukprot:CAMPEP_0169149258 /NCGR_PEP_ID=MMETSP1015-20121227/49407_1 /TAXON_ID=342587 /ORGANISM="Karlodinium micrum, Strain CCMP2283" /LENGTH=48 /DNA_ID= /DNA_START= /DNA_END= /DNA_ORIENTATION=
MAIDTTAPPASPSQTVCASRIPINPSRIEADTKTRSAGMPSTIKVRLN